MIFKKYFYGITVAVLIPTVALADRYGIEEAMNDGFGSAGAGGGPGALWFLAIPLLFWMCSTIPIIWITVGINGVLFTLAGFSSGGITLFIGLLCLAAAWYGYRKERTEEKKAGDRNHPKNYSQEAVPQQKQPQKTDEDALFLNVRIPTPTPQVKTVEVRCDCGKSHSLAADWRGVLRCDACGRLNQVNLDQLTQRQVKKP